VTVGLVWLLGAIYNRRHAPRAQRRSERGFGAVVALILIAAIVLRSVPQRDWLTVGSGWLRVPGLALLVASTAFTLWARFALGTMWTAAPVVKEEHRLRTGGPYGVTRHPIYTGMLGMVVGAVMLDGLGYWVVVPPVVLVILEVKIRAEERLLVETFPEAYPEYRRRVPQLVPGLFLLRGRHPR
jgi:protein-S-isoprenylcysteine O-methyltransferase Ste14